MAAQRAAGGRTRTLRPALPVRGDTASVGLQVLAAGRAPLLPPPVGGFAEPSAGCRCRAADPRAAPGALHSQAGRGGSCHKDLAATGCSRGASTVRSSRGPHKQGPPCWPARDCSKIADAGEGASSATRENSPATCCNLPVRGSVTCDPERGVEVDQQALVAELTQVGALTSPAVEVAFRTVARHRLLEGFYLLDPGGKPPRYVEFDADRPDPDLLARIYSDTALVTRWEQGWPRSSTSQPSLMARMLELLELSPGMRVLEVGAGTGYNAALLAELVGDQHLVVTVDVDEQVVARTGRRLAAAGYADITVLCQDGWRGARDHGPFDRIVATVACPDLSPTWAGQLTPGGWMLIPLEHAGCHPLVRVRVSDGQLRGRVVGYSGFMPARGGLAPLNWWQHPLHLPPDYRPNLPTPPQEAHREPAWDGYRQGPPARGGRSTSDELDFWFFVAITDRRALWGGDHVGLTAGPRGWALARTDGITWWGDPEILEDLHDLHRHWTGLGRPALSDYRLAFHPRNQPAVPVAALTWNIDRHHHRQLTTLPTLSGESSTSA